MKRSVQEGTVVPSSFRYHEIHNYPSTRDRGSSFNIFVALKINYSKFV